MNHLHDTTKLLLSGNDSAEDKDKDKDKYMDMHMDLDLEFVQLIDSDRLALKSGDTGGKGAGAAVDPFYRDVKMKPTQFDIRHFAGEVRYDCSGFIEKNADKVCMHCARAVSQLSNIKLFSAIYCNLSYIVIIYYIRRYSLLFIITQHYLS